jgi:NAD(P)-dependent dehydrogenase (short-subunit alcohol dehydrogenase family)
MRQLDGKVALITGAGSGIGRATALLMASQGASVMVTDIDGLSAERVAAEIARTPDGSVMAVACDIGSEASIAGAIDAAVEGFGRLDVLFNNAALLRSEVVDQDIDILTISPQAWDEMMHVTLRGTMLGCRYGVRAMLPTGGGSIVNSSSTFSLLAHNANVAYGVAKAGINTLTAYVATAFGRQGIRCNAVAPSLIMTPLAHKYLPENVQKLHEDSSALGRLGDPEDVAAIVAFLASDQARFVTGQVIRADGGTLAHQPTYADWRRQVG